MPKIPRDISGRKLAKLLEKYGYKIIRESASHTRLISKCKDKEHKINIPDHNPVKIGTLNNISVKLCISNIYLLFNNFQTD